MNTCDEKSCEMKSSVVSDDRKVAEYFDSAAATWHNMYTRKDIWGEIHQERLARFLALASNLPLPRGSEVLEVGCGAGHAAVALAERGHIVEATDVSQSMVDLTMNNAVAAGVADRIHATVGDIYKIDFSSGTFNLVLSIGVIPWLSSPGAAIEELARVLKPGGYLLFTADNRSRLARLIDPATSPLFSAIKKLFKKIFSSSDHLAPEPTGIKSNQHSLKEVDDFLVHAGLERLQCRTLGFGPFTYFYRKFLPDRLEVAVNRFLQRLVDLEVPLIRSTGAQFVLLARKRP